MAVPPYRQQCGTHRSSHTSRLVDDHTPPYDARRTTHHYQSLATRCVQAWTVGAALAQHLVVRGRQSSTDVVRFCWCSAAFKSDIARSKLFIGTARHACLCSRSCSMTVPRRREQPATRSPGTPGNGVAEGGECLTYFSWAVATTPGPVTPCDGIVGSLDDTAPAFLSHCVDRNQEDSCQIADLSLRHGRSRWRFAYQGLLPFARSDPD